MRRAGLAPAHAGAGVAGMQISSAILQRFWSVAARKKSSCAPFGRRRRKAIHLEDALEVREQHLDHLSLATRDQIGVGRGDVAGEITGALVD